MTVDQICWGSTGVTVHCQGGEQIEADAVIVTVSLGVLKVCLNCMHSHCVGSALSFMHETFVPYVCALAQQHEVLVVVTRFADSFDMHAAYTQTTLCNYVFAQQCTPCVLTTQ